MKNSFYDNIILLLLPLCLIFSCIKNDDSITVTTNDGLNDLYIYDILNNKSKKLTDSADEVELFHQISPNGKMVSYVTDNGQDLYIINLNGGNKKKIFTFNNYGGYDWMPNSTGFIYSNEGNLYTIKSDGTDVKLLVEMESTLANPVYSPDGSKIIVKSFVDLDDELLSITPEVKIESIVKGGASSDYNWSADSEKITYVKYGIAGSLPIFTYDFIEKKENRIAEGSAPIFKPIGDEILYTGIFDQNGVDLNIMKSDGSDVRTITSDNYPQQQYWSPDGTQITFVNTKGNVSLIHTDGSKYIEIFENGGSCKFPQWSADGGYIVYNRYVVNEY